VDRFKSQPNYGVLAKSLKSLHDTHGEQIVLSRWKYYLAKTEAKFVSAPRFAQTFGDWEPSADPDLQPSPLGIRHFDDGYPA